MYLNNNLVRWSAAHLIAPQYRKGVPAASGVGAPPAGTLAQHYDYSI